MKPLTITAVTTFILGILTTLLTFLNWPTWDPALEHATDALAAEYAGIDLPSILEYSAPPAGLYTGSTIMLTLGLMLVGVGALAALLAMHAHTVTQRHD